MKQPPQKLWMLVSCFSSVVRHEEVHPVTVSRPLLFSLLITETSCNMLHMQACLTLVSTEFFASWSQTRCYSSLNWRNKSLIPTQAHAGYYACDMCMLLQSLKCVKTAMISAGTSWQLAFRLTFQNSLACSQGESSENIKCRYAFCNSKQLSVSNGHIHSYCHIIRHAMSDQMPTAAIGSVQPEPVLSSLGQAYCKD